MEGLCTRERRQWDTGTVYNTQTISTPKASLWPWISLASFPIDYNTEATQLRPNHWDKDRKGTWRTWVSQGIAVLPA